MRIFYFFLFLTLSELIASTAAAQSFHTNSGARAAGVAHASVTVSDYASPINNIAGIADAASPVISAGATKHYTIQNLHSLSLQFVKPAKNFSLSASAIRTGDDFLSIQRLAIGVANKIGFMRIGVQVSYLQYTAHELGSKGNVVLEFGGIAELSDKVRLGAHVFNFSQSSITTDPPEMIPLVMKAGLSYQPISKICLLVEVEKEIDFEPLRKVGLEFEPITGVFARTGVSLDPVKNFFGLGFHKKKFLIDYALHNQSRLGLSHCLSLSYQFVENE